MASHSHRYHHRCFPRFVRVGWNPTWCKCANHATMLWLRLLHLSNCITCPCNLASWFCQEEREILLAAANNCHEIETRHQPGGTGMVCRHEFLQYARKPSNDFQGLGWWCSWPFYCNPTHSTRIVVAYRTGSGKSRGPHTIHQQQLWYMQLPNLKGSPQQIFDKDLLHQSNYGASQVNGSFS